MAEDFASFYRREFRAIVALAFAASGSRWAAEDLAQDAFAVAHRSWARIGEYERPGAFVRRVVLNLAVSWRRRRGAELRALARVASRRHPVVEPLEPVDAEFWDHVGALPRRQHQAIVLRYVEDLSVTEIAAVLGCEEATVRVHLHRGHEKLAQRLAPKGDPA